MAEANVDSAQQSQDAQNLDNLTSLQQTGEQGAQTAAGGTADAQVTVNNPPQQDNPSLYNDTAGTTNNQTNYEAKRNESALDTTSFTNSGREGTANESPTIGSGIGLPTDVNLATSEVQYTVTQQTPDIRGSGTDGARSNTGTTGTGAAATPTSSTATGTTVTTTEAPTTTTTEAPTTTTTTTEASPPTTTADTPPTNSTPEPIVDPVTPPPEEPIVDPIVPDPTPQEPQFSNPTVTVTLEVDPGNESLAGSTENATTVTVTLTGSDGSTYTFTDLPVNPDGTWSVPANLLPVFDEEVTYTAEAIATDAAGNDSAPDQSVDIYDLLPTVTVTLEVDPGNESLAGSTENATTVTVTLTGSDGSTYTFTDLPVNPDGTWSVPANLLPVFDEEVTYTAEAIATDAAGNDSAPDQSVDIYDLLPTVTVTLEVSPGNESLAGSTENATTVTVTLTGSDGSTYTFTDLPVNPDGTWSVPANLLPVFDEEVTYTAEAIATDAAGNDSAPDQSVDIYDLLPTVTVTLEVDPGNESLAGSTENATTVTVTLTGSDGSTYTFTDLPVNPDGTWSVPANLLPVFDEEVTYTAEAIATDAAGNDSAPDQSVDIYDLLPTVTVTLEVSPGNESLAGSTENATTVTVTLTGSDGSTYTFTDLPVNPDGTWSVPANLLPVFDEEVTYTAEAIATDAAGNDSAPDQSVDIYDLLPTVTVTLEVDPGNESLAGSTENATTVTVTLTGSDGSTYTFTDLPVNPDGTWSVPANLLPVFDEEVTYTAEAIATDAAGNDSAPDQSVDIYDLLPTVTVTLEVSPGNESLAGSTENATTVTVTLTGSDGSTYTFTDLPVNPDGTWSVPANLLPVFDEEVTYTAEAIATDAAGNDSAPDQSVDIYDLLPDLSLTPVNDSSIILTTDDTEASGGSDASSYTATANSGNAFATAMLDSVTPIFYARNDGTKTIGSFALAVDEAASGLQSDGVDISLTKEENGNVVGKAGTTPIFTISVDGDGVVTLIQSGPIDHFTTTSIDEILSLADGKVSLSATVTVTDGDGDSITQLVSVDLGGAISFEDDGPSLTPTNATSGLLVDETLLGTNDTADFAGLFTPDYGSDGAGTVGNYTLGVKSAGVDSLLVDTASGNHVYLFLEDGVVVGREGTDATNAADGEPVFTVSVSATTGVATLEQIRSVMHSVDGSTSAAYDDPIGIASDLITLTATVTDKDGDTNTGTAQIGGAISFEDDGPSLTPTNATSGLLVDETLLGTNDTADFAGLFTPDYGSDGAGTVGNYTLGVKSAGVDSLLVDTASGNHVYLFLEDGVVVGREGTDATNAADGEPVFTVSVSATTGVATLEQIRSVMHSVDGSTSAAYDDPIGIASDLITLTATVTDKDGDTNTGTAQIGGAISFEDDGPVIETINLAGLRTLESNIFVNSNSSNSFNTAILNSVTPNYGADSNGSKSISGFNLSIGNSTTTITSDGVTIALIKVGNDVVGKAGTTPIFTISVDSNGVVTLTQSGPIDNPGNTAYKTLSLAAGAITLNSTVNVIDGDGDSVATPVAVDLGGNILLDISNITVAKEITSTNEISKIGDKIDYAITVENAGGSDLTGVVVTDSKFKGAITGLTIFDGETNLVAGTVEDYVFDGSAGTITFNHPMLEGASYKIQYSYLVTSLDFNSKSVSNIVTVTSDQDKFTNGDINEIDSIIAQLLTPELSVIKTAEVVDVGSDGADGTTDIASDFKGFVDSENDEIHYTITVQNTGSTNLSGVVINDAMIADSIDLIVMSGSTRLLEGASAGYVLNQNTGTITFNDTMIKGATYTIEYVYLVKQDDIDLSGQQYQELEEDFEIDNTVSAVSNETGTFTADYAVELKSYSDISITKDAYVNGVNTDSATIGSQIDYTLKIVNEGSTTQTGIAVTDTMFSKTKTDFSDVSGQQLRVTIFNADDTVDYKFDATVSGNTINFGENTLLVGQYATIDYSYTVDPTDFVRDTNVIRSITDYRTKNGPQGSDGTPITFSYGKFSAYENLKPNASYDVGGEPATIFINNDNTGFAVGVNSGVMHGDKNGGQEHLKMEFTPSQANNDKSLVEGVSIVFTNATTVELGFKAEYGDGKEFIGSLLIGASGNTMKYNLREVVGQQTQFIKGNSVEVYTFDDGTEGSGSSYSFDNPNNSLGQMYTLSIAQGPGGAQNLLYTLTFNPASDDLGNVNSFDFWVVGDLTSNNVEQIKVVDVKFDVVDFGDSRIENIATVSSVQDNAGSLDGNTDEVANLSINLLTNLTVADALIAQALGESNITIKDTAANIIENSSKINKSSLQGLKVVDDYGQPSSSGLDAVKNAGFNQDNLYTTKVFISDNVSGVAYGPVTYTFTFTEAVSGFSKEMITVSGGVKGDLVELVRDTVYTMMVTPAINSTAPITVSVASDIATTVSQNVQQVDTVNDAPILTGDLSGAILEGGTYVLAAEDLGYGDTDDISSGITFTASSVVNGKIQVGGIDANIFTAVQLAAGSVTFVHDGTETDSASFVVSVEDGNEDGTPPTSSIFYLSVTAVNDAPTISLLSTTTFTEDAAGNAVGSVVATYSTADAEGSNVTVSLSDTTNYVLGTGANAGKVLLTQAGLNLVNAGTDLPAFTLTPNDGTVNGVAISVDPSVTAVNDAPTISLLSTTTFTEDAAGNAVGSVVATYSTADAEGSNVTVSLSDTTNYVLGTGANAGKVLLTQAGLNLVNAGTDLPAFTLTPNDGTVNGVAISVDPSVTAVNDAPTISLLSTTTFTEDAAGNAVGSVVATYSTADAEGSNVTVSLSDTTNYVLGTGANAGKVLLTQAGLNLVNAGTDLPAFTLTPNDGTVNGVAISVDPSVTAVNDAPTISLLSTTTFTEDAAGNAVGSVVATYSTADAEGSNVTVSLSDTTNYVLGTGANAGKVLLTQAGLNLVNAGTDLPAFTLTPNDGTVNGVAISVDPSVTAVNDAPTISLLSTTTFTEDAAGNAVGSVVATYSTADAEGSNVTVSLSDTTNYVLGTGANAGKVLLTQAGLNLVNAGTDLPAFTLTPNDGTVNGVAISVDPSVTAVNDAPTISLLSTTTFTEDAAGNAVGSVVATYSTADAEGSNVTVSLSDTTNYVLGTGANAGKVLLTQAGLNLVNAGTDLPAFTLTPNDGTVNGVAISVDPSVTAVNDAPTISLLSTTTFTEDAAGNAVGSVVATYSTADAEGSNVTVSLSDTTNYVLGTGANAGKVLLTQAGLNLVNAGTDLPAFTLTPNDGTVNGVAISVDPSVTAVNDAPTISLLSTTTFTEDAAGNAVGSVVATYSTADAEGSNVTVSLSDTTNYVLGTGANAGKVLLTQAGLNLVNAGTDLPAFTLTPNDGTVNGVAISVDPSVIAVNAPGYATITRSGNTLTASVSDSDGVISPSYVWYFGGVVKSGVTGATYTLSTSEQNNSPLVYVIATYTGKGTETATSPTYLVEPRNSTLTKQPISLDLNGDGVSYFSQDSGVTYDYNNDGIAESTAWVAPEDGLLALQKEDGTHNIVFSTQDGETDLQGLAKVYDSNKDSVLDSSDSDFAKFGVWQDADSDGIVDAGEFLSLADRNITSLSLTSDGQVHFEANGDVIVYGQTTYTTSDGQLHIAEDVGFAVSDIYEPLDIASIIANADAIESVTRIDQLAETDSSSSLFVELGGQTYEIATLPGHEAGTEDILSQFVGGDTSANLLSNKSWTDVIDISSEHGGPGSIIAAGGTLNEGNYANAEGDWTVIINSGDAQVDVINNQITFASESAENSVTIVTADGASHDINNVDKIQWHG